MCIDQTIIDFPGEVYTPEQRLWFNVLVGVTEDALRPTLKHNKSSHYGLANWEDIVDAIGVFEDTSPGKERSFHLLCEYANQDPDVIQERYYKAKYKLRSQGELKHYWIYTDYTTKVTNGKKVA